MRIRRKGARGSRDRRSCRRSNCSSSSSRRSSGRSNVDGNRCRGGQRCVKRLHGSRGRGRGLWRAQRAGSRVASSRRQRSKLRRGIRELLRNDLLQILVELGERSGGSQRCDDGKRLLRRGSGRLGVGSRGRRGSSRLLRRVHVRRTRRVRGRRSSKHSEMRRSTASGGSRRRRGLSERSERASNTSRGLRKRSRARDIELRPTRIRRSPTELTARAHSAYVYMSNISCPFKLIAATSAPQLVRLGQ